MMKSIKLMTSCGLLILLTGCLHRSARVNETRELAACSQTVLDGLMSIPETRDMRFLGKVSEPAAMCRGGQKAAQFRMTPWVDWSQYWGAGGVESLPKNYLSPDGAQLRGVSGALMDLEYQDRKSTRLNSSH